MQPAIVQWMEWPAEVVAAKPFSVQLLTGFPACHKWVFKSAVGADQSAVTFAPYFLVERGEPVCLSIPETLEVFPVPNLGLDTSVTAPGLATTVERTFEIRASTAFNAPPPSPSPNAGDIPVRTFGDVIVRLSNPDSSRRNAAGVVTLSVDIAGCARVHPGGYFAGLVLEDQADTTGLTNVFVRGYIHEVATPVCGQTHVFHLVTRN